MGILFVWSVSLHGMEFNNAALEKTISVVWADFVDALVHEVKERGIGKAQTPQDFFVPVLQATIAKTDVRSALHSASSAQEKELKKTLERVLTNVMTEVSDTRPDNDYLEILYQLVATTIKLDDLYLRYHGSEDTRKALRDVVNEINKIITAFETSSASPKERAEAFKDALDALIQVSLKSSEISRLSGIHDLYDSLGYIGSLFTSENVDISFSIMQRCVASVRYALDLIQQRYGGTTQAEAKGGYIRFMKAGAILENCKKVYKLLFSRPRELDWCTCEAASFEIRVALIIRLGQDAKRRFSAYKGRLVYTSIGSGSHLQDYLIIQELRAQGFKFLDINLMELDTRDIKEIHAMLDHPHTDVQKIHAEHLLETALDQAISTAALVKKLDAFMWHAGTIKDRPKAKDRGTYLTLYQNAHDYIDFAIKYPEFKAHILVLVDPSGALFATHDMRQANAILMTPHYQPEKRDIQEQEDEESEVLTDEQLKNALLLLLPRSPGIEAYTTIKKPYDVLYTTFFAAVTDILKQEKVATEYIPQLGRVLTSGRLEKELAQYLNKDFPFKFWFIANAYIAFYDIVVNAMNPAALLYQADCIDEACHSTLTAISDSKKYLTGPILPYELVKTWSPDFERWYPDVKLLTYEPSKDV